MRLSVWSALIPVIGVEDLERTTRFYTQGLGFSMVRAAGEANGQPAFAHFRLGGVELVTYTLEPATAGMQDRIGRKKLHLYVVVSDVDALSAELRIRRISVLPVSTVAGGRYCDVEDPDGYRLRFGSAPDPVPYQAPAPARSSG